MQENPELDNHRFRRQERALGAAFILAFIYVYQIANYLIVKSGEAMETASTISIALTFSLVLARVKRIYMVLGAVVMIVTMAAKIMLNT